jgi:signal peptidase I
VTVRDKNWWISELISLAVVLAAVTVARSSLADHYYVPSGSMEYSLMPGDRVIVNKTAYGFRIPLTKIDIFGSSTPTRGDIAVFD